MKRFEISIPMEIAHFEQVRDLVIHLLASSDCKNIISRDEILYKKGNDGVVHSMTVRTFSFERSSFPKKLMNELNRLGIEG